jgi:hypothetical protein
MFAVASTIPARQAERWLLWLAAVGRLTGSRATGYLRWSNLTDADRTALVDELLKRTRRLARIDLPAMLGKPWSEIHALTTKLVV